MRYLRRSHQFLTERPFEEVEQQADRFFPALGYRRRQEWGRGLPLFVRGRRLASLYTPSLRRCLARVELRHRPSGTGEGGLVTVRHEVEVLGRLLPGSDAELLDAESRAFQQFVQLDLSAVDPTLFDRAIARARRAALRSSIITLAVAGGIVGVAYALIARL